MEVNYGLNIGDVIIIGATILFLWLLDRHRRRKKLENQILTSEKPVKWDGDEKEKALE